MNNWKVTIINTVEPFDKKEILVHSETVIEALGIADGENPGYYARSAMFHHSSYGDSHGHQQA